MKIDSDGETEDTLTSKEIAALMSAPPDNTDWGIRDRAILRLLYFAGLQCGELSQLKIRDVDFLLNEVQLMDGRTVPFDEKTAQNLHSYIQCYREHFRSRDDILFPGRSRKPMTRQGIWKIVRKYGQQAGIPYPVTPQLLRKTRQQRSLQREDYGV